MHKLCLVGAVGFGPTTPYTPCGTPAFKTTSFYEWFILNAAGKVLWMSGAESFKSSVRCYVATNKICTNSNVDLEFTGCFNKPYHSGD